MRDYGPPKMASKAFDGLDSAARFQVERSPMSLRAEGSAADLRDGSHGVAGLRLLRRNTEAIDTGVTRHPRRTGDVLDSVPITGKESRRSGEPVGYFANDDLLGRRERIVCALFEDGGDRVHPFGRLSQKLAVV